MSVRISASHNDKKGDYTNSADGTSLGDRQTKTIAATAYATPTDNLSVKLFAEYARFDDGPGPSGRYNSITQSTCSANGGPRNNWFCGVVPEINKSSLGQNGFIDDIFRTNLINRFSIFDDKFIKKAGLAKRNLSLHGTIRYDLDGGYQFESITAYHTSATMIVSDETARDTRNIRSVANPFRTFLVNQFLVERDFKDFYQELRLSSAQDGPFRWAFGGSYVHPNIIASSVSAEIDAAQPFLAFSTFPRFTSDTLGVFGGTYYDVTESITVSAEARYQVDKVEVAVPGQKRTFKSFAPRVTAEYKPTEDWTTFVNWARGFRPGAFNARLLTLSPTVVAEIVRQTGAQVGIDEESMDMYEIGVKGSFWNQSGNISLVGYTGKITNQQITSTAIVDINNTGLLSGIQVVSNAGSTNLKGIELESEALFPVGQADTFVINGTFAWNDVSFGQYICTTCLLFSSQSNVAGNKFPKAPTYAASLTSTYTHPLQSGMELYGRAEYLYRGSFFATEANLAKSGSSNRINLRIGLQSDSWSVEGFVTNLTNDDTVLSIERQPDPVNPGRQTIAFALPELRHYGLRVKYNF